MHSIPPCSIHPSVPLILFGGCSKCLREKYSLLSDAIMARLSLAEADGDQDDPPETPLVAPEADSTRLDGQTLPFESMPHSLS